MVLLLENFIHGHDFYSSDCSIKYESGIGLLKQRKFLSIGIKEK